MLRCSVRRHVRRSSLSRNRRDVDDAAPAVFDHFRQPRMRATKRSAEINVQVTFPQRLISINEQRRLSDAGVVDYDVGSAAKFLFKTTKGAQDAFRVRNIAFDRE